MLAGDLGLALTHGSTSELGYSVLPVGRTAPQLGANGVGPDTGTGGVVTAAAPDAARTTIASALASARMRRRMGTSML
jgi:hypothetical protein